MDDMILEEIPTPELFVLYIPSINHVVTKLKPLPYQASLRYSYESTHIDNIDLFNNCDMQLESKLADVTSFLFQYGIQMSDGLPELKRWMWVAVIVSNSGDVRELNWRNCSTLGDWV